MSQHIIKNPLSDLCKQTKMSCSLLSFHGPSVLLIYTEACQKCSPQGQCIGVNREADKYSHRLQDLFSL